MAFSHRMIHSAPDYQKAREIGSKCAEFQIPVGAVAKRDRRVSPGATQQMLRARCRNGLLADIGRDPADVRVAFASRRGAGDL
jgi:hypothetical protein